MTAPTDRHNLAAKDLRDSHRGEQGDHVLPGPAAQLQGGAEEKPGGVVVGGSQRD